jgi:hypothetical protein
MDWRSGSSRRASVLQVEALNSKSQLHIHTKYGPTLNVQQKGLCKLLHICMMGLSTPKTLNWEGRRLCHSGRSGHLVSLKAHLFYMYMDDMFLSFFGTRIWTQGLTFARQASYHLSLLPALFCVGYFWDRGLWTICPGWSWTAFSPVARITGMSLWCLAWYVS